MRSLAQSFVLVITAGATLALPAFSTAHSPERPLAAAVFLRPLCCRYPHCRGVCPKSGQPA